MTFIAKSKKIRFYKNYDKIVHKGGRVKYGYDTNWGIEHYSTLDDKEAGDLYYRLRHIQYVHDYGLNRTVLWNSNYTVDNIFETLRDSNGFPFVDWWNAYANYGGTYKGFCKFLKKYSKVFPNRTIFVAYNDKYDMTMEAMIKNDITMEQTLEIVKKDMEDWARIRKLDIISVYD